MIRLFRILVGLFIMCGIPFMYGYYLLCNVTNATLQSCCFFCILLGCCLILSSFFFAKKNRLKSKKEWEKERRNNASFQDESFWKFREKLIESREMRNRYKFHFH